MPKFFELQTGDWKTKALLVCVVLVLIGFGGIMHKQFAPPPGAGPVLLKCQNPECDSEAIELTQKEFMEMTTARNKEYMEEMGIEVPEMPEGAPPMPEMMPGMGMPGMGMMMQWGRPGFPLKCPTCGENSLYKVDKCKECGALFMPDYTVFPPDKCPECGYSRSEERRKELQQEKTDKQAQKRDRKKNRKK